MIGMWKTGAVSAMVTMTALLFASAMYGGQTQADLLSAGTRGLRILYVGRPVSDREKDFVDFLGKYFDVVRTSNLETFKEADAEGFDVTLLDWDFGVFEGPCPSLSESFSRPVITLGVHGSLMCSRWRLKTGYL